MPEFRRGCAVAELPPGGGMPIAMGGRTVALFNVDGRFYAIDDRCPHRGAPLSDGALQGTTVICPLHRWHFNLASGDSETAPGICIETFPVEVRSGDVYVAIPDAAPPVS